MSKIRIIILLLVAVAMGIIYNLFSVNRIDFFPSRAGVLSEQYRTENKQDSGKWSYNPDKIAWHPVRTDQAYYVYKHNLAKFIDPRDEWDFKDMHIKNAINIPLYKFSMIKNIVLSSLKKKDLIIVYCEDNTCDDGKSLCDSLVKYKFKNVFLYKGGLDEWTFADYPVEQKNK